MKKTLLLCTCVSILSLNCANSTAKETAIQLEEIQGNVLLDGIETKIFEAFVQANINKRPTALQELKKELDDMASRTPNQLITYWQSYLRYYLSIFYMTQNQEETAEKEIDDAVDLMDGIKNKNTEDYALLALTQSFSIQFKGFRAMFISSAIKKNGKRSLSLEPKNIRAYFVLASNDFYTPEKYGGGEQAEGYLLKAISLPDQLNKNPYTPSWGKQEAYELLVKHYMKTDQRDRARTYCKEGIALYPDNYGLGKLAIKLLD
ncbi:MAG: hypothetical protein HRT65_09930 [Flavobacteriaceae bacterium]|nr:hypothetical protein [Flavobacteriaceae bacterium]